MRAQRVAIGDARVIEVLERIASHPEPLHDRDGRRIEPGGPGQDLGEVPFLEAETQGCATGLGGVAVAPGEPSQPPTDLDRRREWRLERRWREAREAKEATVVSALERPLRHAVRLESGLDGVDHLVALLARHDASGNSA